MKANQAPPIIPVCQASARMKKVARETSRQLNPTRGIPQYTRCRKNIRTSF